MATEQVLVQALDGPGNTLQLRGDQNPDNSVVLRSSLEVGGAAVGSGNAIPVADAIADAALGTPADTAWTGSGTSSIVAALKAIWTKLGSLTTTLAAGTQAIGSVTVSNLPTTQPVSGAVSVSNFPGTQPVSFSGQSVTLAAGSATVGAVTQAGTIGADRSANAPSGPGGATSFSFNGTTVNLLATIAANPNRRGLEINNTTGALVVVVLDDGANTAGTVSLFPLAAGAGAFQQGGDFSPPNELGRCRIFGATGTYCYARET